MKDKNIKRTKRVKDEPIIYRVFKYVFHISSSSFFVRILSYLKRYPSSLAVAKVIGMKRSKSNHINFEM